MDLRKVWEKVKQVTTLTAKDKETNLQTKYVNPLTGEVNVWVLKPLIEEVLRTMTDSEIANEYYAFQGAHWKGENMRRDVLMIAMMSRMQQAHGKPIMDFVMKPHVRGRTAYVCPNCKIDVPDSREDHSCVQCSNRTAKVIGIAQVRCVEKAGPGKQCSLYADHDGAHE